MFVKNRFPGSPPKTSPSRSSRPTTPSKPAAKPPAKRSRSKPKLVTRSGRKVKVPQLDGIDGISSDEDLKLPQLDGNDGTDNRQFGANQIQSGVQMAFAVNQGNSGVIPIIMPPGTFGTISFYFFLFMFNILGENSSLSFFFENYRK